MVSSFSVYVIQSPFLSSILQVWRQLHEARQLIVLLFLSFCLGKQSVFNDIISSACRTLVTCGGLCQSTDSFPLPCTFCSSSLSSVHLLIYSSFHSFTDLFQILSLYKDIRTEETKWANSFSYPQKYTNT
jgi:hypothetical protein